MEFFTYTNVKLIVKNNTFIFSITVKNHKYLYHCTELQKLGWILKLFKLTADVVNECFMDCDIVLHSEWREMCSLFFTNCLHHWSHRATAVKVYGAPLLNHHYRWYNIIVLLYFNVLTIIDYWGLTSWYNYTTHYIIIIIVGRYTITISAAGQITIS